MPNVSFINQTSTFQDIDLATGTSGTIQSGNRKLLGKANPVHAVQVHDGLLYAASTSLDGAAVKVISFEQTMVKGWSIHHMFYVHFIVLGGS